MTSLMRIRSPSPIFCLRVDRLIVQEGAVGAVQVFQEELVLDAQNLGVVPAGIEILDGNVAVGVPAQNQLGLSISRMVPVPAPWITCRWAVASMFDLVASRRAWVMPGKEVQLYTSRFELIPHVAPVLA